MSALVHQEHFRALQLFDQIPAGHTGVIVTGSDFEPHLRRGEIAIVDTTDQSVEFGELYVLRMNMMSEPRLRRLEIVQLTRDDGGLWYAFSLPGAGEVMFEGRRGRYADGPLRRAVILAFPLAPAPHLGQRHHSAPRAGFTPLGASITCPLIDADQSVGLKFSPLPSRWTLGALL